MAKIINTIALVLNADSGSLVMLVYVSFFILTFAGGVLSGHRPCDSEPLCPKNEHYTRNNPRCIRTCANKWVPISDDCKPFTGCVCDDGLVRVNDDGSGPCIPEHKCPCRDDPKNPGDRIYSARADALAFAEATQEQRIESDLKEKFFSHSSSKASSYSSSSSYTSVVSSDCGENKCKDPNAVYKKCPNPCPLTCDQPNPRPCNKMCIREGCECAPGFVLNEVSGRCVRLKDCPKNKCEDPNAVFKECPNPCPLTCDNPNPRPCGAMCIKEGCECAPGFVLNEDSGRCVRLKDCPKKRCRDPNAVFKECPNPCPLSCDQPFPRPCNKACVKYGCECAPGFILNVNNKHGRCIRPQDCPEPICYGKHEHYVINDSQCPKTCGNRMLPYSDTAGACVPFTGCVCKSGYVRKYDNATGPCIPERKCPPIPTQCGINEVPTSCRIICPPQTCTSIFSRFYCLPTECEPGCDCLNGYLRNSDGVCIPSEDCFKTGPVECGENEVPSDCAIVCPPQSCESLYTTYMCAESNCTPGCNCIDGYLRNSLGLCVPSEECYSDPSGCNGDVNATHIRGCGSACPPTCDNPSPVLCPEICVLNGCECKLGYILSCEGGDCIAPTDCPGGSPNCGANQTYVDCKVDCPTNYCPVDDSRAQVACSMPYPCPGGCACIGGYLIVSRDDPRCVLASDCPEVECTRPNEVWNPNPTNCFFERCEDRGSVCNYPYSPGPRCVCQEGFYRNENDICIPASECPPICEDPNAEFKECPSACEPTCAKPDPNQACTRQCMPSGCVCKPGFVLNEEDGKCIEPGSCPVDNGCNGDMNATYSECPSSCPVTCANRNSEQNLFCPAVCDPSFCVCKLGFILTEKGGICVNPEDCPDPGCGGDPNAVYKTCPSACEPTCEKPDPNQPCTKQCMPSGCVCKPGFVLNKDTGICIDPESCPDKSCGGNPNAVYSNCPSACEPTCANQDPQICTLQCMPSGCVCKPGFVLNEETGKCVEPETCPADPKCNGDRNATFTQCPSYCQATCKHPDTDGDCMDMCMPPGCVCKHGYLLNKKGGRCIKPEDCPGGWPRCGANETYVYCKVGCPTNYCPIDDSLAIIACDPMYPCPGGCACKGGYSMISEADDRCILSSECPPVECTRPNEVWDPYAPGCLHERCDDRDIPCDFPYPGPPRCRCIGGYYRNQDDICVPECECPPRGCNGDMNATFSECPSRCPATCGVTDVVCTADCAEPGCVCNEGFVLSEPGGVCIRHSDCPGQTGCNGDMNATFSECPSKCPATCCEPDRICTADCAEPGCECNYGFILSEPGGVCIRPYDCPGGSPHCCENMTFVGCKIDCDMKYCPVDEDEIFRICDPVWPCDSGCECKQGYLKTNTPDHRCILAADCPPVECTRPNEVWDPTPPTSSSDITHGRPKCVCKEGFSKDNTGVCVPDAPRPPGGCNGDMNATFSECPSKCPATCCEPDRICTADCAEPGCVCNYGFILSEPGGVCISPYDCPGGSPHCCENMTFVGCKIDCDMKYCPVDEDEIFRICDPVWPCDSGCECKQGYLKTNTPDHTCILAADCPPVECTRPNEVWDPTPPTSSSDITHGRPKCVCKEGFSKDNTGVCVPEAPRPPGGCNGDMNATYSECPSRCPATCCQPDSDRICTADCAEPGCVCNYGFILSEPGGVCISPYDCPGGSPHCCENMTYVGCKIDCDMKYCPVDEDEIFRICDPVWPCASGCECKQGYLKTNTPDHRCILAADCPPVECTRPNEEWDPTPPTSSSDITHGRPKCVCKEGFSKDNTGVCVPDAPRPPGGCNGDMNATFSECPRRCPATCCQPDSDRICTADCAEPGCVCNYGFILSAPGGVCISPYDCPGGSPHCCENMTYVGCKIECPTNYCPLDENEIIIICDPVWPCPSGCVCEPGYLMTNTPDHRCILAADCPPVECTRPNEVWDPSPSSCNYERCDEMYYICDDTSPGRPKCVCKEGYYRDNDGDCIPAEECPQPKCGYNEVAVPCRQKCPPQNCEIAYTEYACTKESEICEPGCDCLPDHLRNGSGICIPNEECPYPSTPVCGINEIARDCRQICPPQTCQSKYIMYNCVQDLPCEPGCDCIANYLRDDDGICVPSEKCPAPEPICGYNEVAVPCRQICPPQNCEIAYTDYACTKESEICEPGCDCLPDHLRNGSGICIPNEECPYPSTPVCGINEIARDCRRICPPQSCLSKYALIRCAENIPCEPGCDCVANYLRDERGICIPSEQCPAPCQISDECKRTCAEPNPPNCVYNPPKVNMDGCDCMDGYILSELGGECIPIEECPPDIACHGDPNATPKRCPKPCPSTCNSPNQFPCKRMCEPIACECKPGYILSDESGQCTLPDQCPGGNPCGENEHFAYCRADCPGTYCPVDDSREIQFCDPPVGHCLSGCICNLNHKRKSREDPRCIVSSDCPPVNCTRPNEKWSPCPSACLAENCEDITNQPTVCNTLVLNCDPRCICRKNHFRDSTGICIPAKDCPPVCEDPNAMYKECPSACEPTCDNPDPQICTMQCMPSGCVCKPGFVLNQQDGTCIEPENCPVPGCGGDPNAMYKDCPSACEPTCTNQNPQVCTDQCMPSGCVCIPGFVLNEQNGQCVQPGHCPAPVCEDPNAVYKECPSACEPTCDNPDPQICTMQCMPSGCVCKPGFVLNQQDGTCIEPEYCPAPVCEDPNAVYKECPSACEPTCTNQNPQMCTEQCMPSGCVCKPGFVLNENDGKCIKPEKCPAC